MFILPPTHASKRHTPHRVFWIRVLLCVCVLFTAQACGDDEDQAAPSRPGATVGTSTTSTSDTGTGGASTTGTSSTSDTTSSTTSDTSGGCSDDEGCDVGFICEEEACIEGCRIDAECGLEQICEDNACAAGCRTDDQCPGEEACIDGACSTDCAEDTSCEDGEICVEGECISGCRTDDQCGEGLVCENEACIEGCREDEACGEDQICLETRCVEGCRTNSDCGLERVCSDNVCTDGCATDNDCPGGEICRDDACVPRCGTDSECGLGRICTNAQCVDGCRNDDGCQEGELCVDGACERESCRNDVECGDGRVCEDNLCIDGCREDIQCSEDQICEGGACINGCRADSTCDVGDICLQNTCVRGCRGDSQCASGRVCENLECVLGCRNDNTCPSGQVCENDACIAGCREDFECSGGSICENTQCVLGCRNDAECNIGRICEELVCIPGCRGEGSCPGDQICNLALNQCEDPIVDACQDDRFEPNNSFDDPESITEGIYDDLSICAPDNDLFRINLEAGRTLFITISYDTDEGSLDLELYDPRDLIAAQGEPIENGSAIVYEITSPGLHTIRVRGSNTSQEVLSYSLTISSQEIGGPCAPDQYESNNSAATATSVPIRQLDGGAYCPGDEDWYAFELQEGDNFISSLNFDPNINNLDYQIIAPDRTTVLDTSAGTSGREFVEATAQSTGTHYIRVFAPSNEQGNARSSYRIYLIVTNLCGDRFDPNEDFQRAPDIGEGTTSSLLLCDENDLDFFGVDVISNSDVTITANFDASQGNIDIQLIAPDGETVVAESSADVGNSERIDHRSEATGRYYVRVSARSVPNRDIGYSITTNIEVQNAGCDDPYEPNNTQAAAGSPPGNSAPAATVCPGDPDWYTVNVDTAGSTINVFMESQSGQGNATVAIIDRNGTTVLDEDLSDASIKTLTASAPATGVYYVRVTHDEGAAVTHNISWRTVEPPDCADDDNEPNDTFVDATPLSEPIGASLCETEEDFYTFTTNSAFTFTRFILRFNGPNTAIAQILDEDGAIIAEESSLGRTTFTVSGVTEGVGRFYVRVAQSNGPIVNYSVDPSFENLPNCDDAFEDNDTLETPADITPGSYTNLTICQVADASDYYRLVLAAEASVTVEILFSQLFGDLDLEIFSEAGDRLIWSETETNNERIQTSLVAGTYIIHVTNFNNSSNTYDLSISTQ